MKKKIMAAFISIAAAVLVVVLERKAKNVIVKLCSKDD